MSKDSTLLIFGSMESKGDWESDRKAPVEIEKRQEMGIRSD
jgi:hypothetical protein